MSRVEKTSKNNPSKLRGGKLQIVITPLASSPQTWESPLEDFFAESEFPSQNLKFQQPTSTKSSFTALRQLFFQSDRLVKHVFRHFSDSCGPILMIL